MATFKLEILPDYHSLKEHIANGGCSAHILNFGAWLRSVMISCFGWFIFGIHWPGE